MKNTPAVDSDAAEFERFGRAALIPGIRKSIEYLQAMLDEVRGALVPPPPTARQVIDQAKRKEDGRGRYWAGMTAEERSDEMKRRMRSKNLAKAATKAAKATAKSRNHPRYSEHPNHEAWLQKIVAARAKTRARRAER
jgi:hypothetical protein